MRYKIVDITTHIDEALDLGRKGKAEAATMHAQLAQAMIAFNTWYSTLGFDAAGAYTYPPPPTPAR